MKKFQQMATERSVQSEHLNLVVEHIDTALLCFDERNAVKIANNAAKTLLKTKFVPSLAKISTINPQLAAQITKIKSGEQLVQNCTIEKDQLQLIISASEFKLLDKSYKLVSLKDVKRELDEKEIESWRKLIRVINHEIINSMTPIVSLSGYMNRFLHNGEKLKRLVDNTSKEFGLLSRSIETINMRSQGLVDFINAYRGLIQHPQKNFSNIDINAFFQRIGLLLESKLGEQNIQFETVLAKPDMLLRADEASLEQIIINLIYNAVEALEGIEPARITLESNINREGKIIIQVHDNGKGIQEQFMENIFTPFFSTKERNSGVGLSISKQLAQLNKASLSVQSVENEGSTFTLSFSQDGQTPTIL